MLYTEKQFFDEIFDLRVEYRTQNKWVENWRKWNDDAVYKQFLKFAFHLYENTAKNMLHFTLLGDTEIRSMEDLVMNFGLMSANGVQDEKDEKMVAGAQGARDLMAGGGKFIPTKVLGPGSILGDKQWTPILNDSLMLGSIAGGQEFHLVLNTVESALWKQLGFADTSKVAQLAQQFGGQQAEKVDKNAKQPINRWNYFLRVSPATLWNPKDNVPRVFIRELMALKLAGYKPQFFNSQLSFAPTGAPGPTFKRYLQFLEEINFPGADRTRLYSEVGEFLFNDKAFKWLP